MDTADTGARLGKLSSKGSCPRFMCKYGYAEHLVEMVANYLPLLETVP